MPSSLWYAPSATTWEAGAHKDQNRFHVFDVRQCITDAPGHVETAKQTPASRPVSACMPQPRQS